MSEHFTLDELAELDAGLLARRRAPRADRRRASEAATHLADCDQCSARFEALRRTRDALRDLRPEQMPADVADRLERALANADTTTGEDVVPDLGAYRARRFGGIPPWAYAAAAAVVVLGAIGIAIGTTHGHKSGTSTSADAPLVPTTDSSAARQQAVRQQETGRTYTPDSIAELASGLVSGSAAADTLAARTPEFAHSQGAGADGAGGGVAATQPRAAKTTNGAPQSNTAAVPNPGVAPPMDAIAGAPIPKSLRRLADSRTALLQCAAFISDTPNASPVAVDFGRWTNAAAGIRRVPSVIFVFNDLTDPHSIDVFVVGAACDDNSLLDYEVLDKTS